MRRPALLSLLFGVLLTQQAAAQTLAYGDIEQVIRFGDETGAIAGRRLEAAPQPVSLFRTPVAYGPFQVVGETRAVMRGITDTRTPGSFQAMMRDYPKIRTLEMAMCPGTYNDQANLRLGRLIRASGLSTYVPDKGFVGSGAVELFLAGVRRYAEPSARFAVHSWEDDYGREPGDLSIDAVQNRRYLDYYRAMGMTEKGARAFYAMTNSVPFERALWLSAAEMDRWIAFDSPDGLRSATPPTPRRMAYGG